MVRVELDLAVVPREVGRVVKAIIGIRLLSLSIRVTNTRVWFLLATRYALAFVYTAKADVTTETSPLPDKDKQCLCDDSTLTVSMNKVTLTISLSNKESTMTVIRKRLLNTVTQR